MHWIKPKHIVATVLLIGVAGCASQDTVLPAAERKMIDIYRDATNQTDSVSAPVFGPNAICSSLALDETPAGCEKKLTEHAESVYRYIDEANPAQPLEYVEYTRTVLTELNNLFPRHDNPDMVIYVYPHLATRSRVPIPGYTTVMPLYERVEYRLPGEAIRTTPKLMPGDWQ